MTRCQIITSLTARSGILRSVVGAILGRRKHFWWYWNILVTYLKHMAQADDFFNPVQRMGGMWVEGTFRLANLHQPLPADIRDLHEVAKGQNYTYGLCAAWQRRINSVVKGKVE